MHSRILWFDSLRERVSDAEKAAKGALPGLSDPGLAEIGHSLARAEVLLIAPEVAERLIKNGDAPEDLKKTFDTPFDEVLFQFDQPEKLPEESGEGVRGILVSNIDGRYRVRAWFEERRRSIEPRYDFELTPGESKEGPINRISNLLYWISGYISSPNVLAIRHNRRHELVRSYRAAGRPMPSSYYTFAEAGEPRKPRVRRKLGEQKPRMTEVHGHFRRAHWHSLPSRLGKAWFPTTWVRSYKRRVAQPRREVALKSAA